MCKVLDSWLLFWVPESIHSKREKQSFQYIIELSSVRHFARSDDMMAWHDKSFFLIFYYFIYKNVSKTWRQQKKRKKQIKFKQKKTPASPVTWRCCLPHTHCLFIFLVVVSLHLFFFGGNVNPIRWCGNDDDEKKRNNNNIVQCRS